MQLYFDRRQNWKNLKYLFKDFPQALHQDLELNFDWAILKSIFKLLLCWLKFGLWVIIMLLKIWFIYLKL